MGHLALDRHRRFLDIAGIEGHSHRQAGGLVDAGPGGVALHHQHHLAGLQGVPVRNHAHGPLLRTALFVPLFPVRPNMLQRHEAAGFQVIAGNQQIAVFVPPKAEGFHALFLQVRMILASHRFRVHPDAIGPAHGLVLVNLALRFPRRQLRGGFVTQTLFRLPGQHMARGEPFAPFAGLVILIPAVGPSVRITAVCAVPGPRPAADDRHALNLAVHDRLALNDEPGILQGLPELLPGIERDRGGPLPATVIVPTDHLLIAAAPLAVRIACRFTPPARHDLFLEDGHLPFAAVHSFMAAHEFRRFFGICRAVHQFVIAPFRLFIPVLQTGQRGGILPGLLRRPAGAFPALQERPLLFGVPVKNFNEMPPRCVVLVRGDYAVLPALTVNSGQHADPAACFHDRLLKSRRFRLLFKLPLDLRRFLLLQPQHIFLDLVSVPSGPDDLFRVFLQRLYPACHIRLVLPRIVADAQFHAQHVAGDLGPQFLTGILAAAVGMAHQFPVQAAFVARPVPQLVQGRGVIAVRRMKLLPFGQVDFVGRGPVEGPVRLVVKDRRAGCLEQLFRSLVALERRFRLQFRFRRQGRQVLDLRSVEHHRVEDLGTVQLRHLVLLLSLVVEYWLAPAVPEQFFVFPLPILHQDAASTPLHLRPEFLCLLVGTPAVVVGTHSVLHQAQSQVIDAPVGLAGERVHRPA